MVLCGGWKEGSRYLSELDFPRIGRVTFSFPLSVTGDSLQAMML